MEVRNIRFSYGDESIIKDLSFSLSGGRRIAVMGESGKGKTTLLKLLLGLLRPSSGVIERQPSERISVVFQEDRLLPWFSALRNVDEVSASPELSRRLLEEMELGESIDKLPKELSGGMQRRVAIARALAFGGNVLLLDEPFKGLDPDMRERIAKKILLHSEGASILLITHDEREAELMDCERIIRL